MTGLPMATLGKGNQCKLQKTCCTLQSRNEFYFVQSLQAQKSCQTSCMLHAATYLQLVWQHQCNTSCKKNLAFCYRGGGRQPKPLLPSLKCLKTTGRRIRTIAYCLLPLIFFSRKPEIASCNTSFKDWSLQTNIS